MLAVSAKSTPPCLDEVLLKPFEEGVSLPCQLVVELVGGVYMFRHQFNEVEMGRRALLDQRLLQHPLQIVQNLTPDH
jgi:hypothetical protein